MDITGFLKGRVRVKIHGRQPERFLNLALRSNIFLSDIEKKNEDIYFTVSPKGFLMLRHIARKTGISKEKYLRFYLRCFLLLFFF